MYDMWAWHGLFPFFGLLWFVLWIVLLGVMAWLAYKVFTHLREDDPLEIAKRRYAKGEISEEEYEAIKEELS